ncbi:MAG: CHASE domain-containing protein [Gammaproteobacteria bacterium]
MDSPSSYPGAVRFARSMHNPYTAWIILGVSLLLTVGAYHLSERFVQKRAEDRFHYRALELEHAITTRLYLYEQLLWSGVALMNASGTVDREDFRQFVNTMNIDRRWPGIQGFGYSQLVRPDDLQSHIDTIRAQGFEDYAIKPEGERDLYCAIIYLEPFDWRNQRAFGYDMYSNPTRREAMERARDTARRPRRADHLVQETRDDIQAGFLTYVPVYETKTTPATVEARRRLLRGWIYAPFRAGNLMRGILGAQEKEIQFTIYDGLEVRPESLLFSSNKVPDVERGTAPLISRRVQLTLQGRPWVLLMSTPPDTSLAEDQNLPRYVALGGIVIDLLLFYVIFSLHFINRRAEAIATDRTRELEQARRSLEDQIQTRTRELQSARDSLEHTVQERTRLLQEKLHELETLNSVTVGREERILALKTEVNELCIRLGQEPRYDSVR